MEELLQWMEYIEDIRQEKKVRHLLKDILVIILFATLANADDWVETALFAENYQDCLRKYIELKNGVPSHDTMRRVMGMRINGNFFNFMNSSLFNRHFAVSGMFGRRNAGSANMPDWNRVNKYSKTYMKDGVLYHVGNKNADRNRVNKYSKTYMKDGVLYHRGNRTESKLYTRQGTSVGARPNQRRPFYSGQQILDAIKKYDSYTLTYDGRSTYFQGHENVYRSNGKYAGSHPVGEKMYFNPADINDALGIHNPKQMSVKDNEVRFDSYSYYQFEGKDGRNHTVLSVGSSLSAGTFANFGKERIDKEAVEYADFWEDVAHGNVWSRSLLG